ncbi:hypothetical protein L798_04647 [Zootermopsis nevadensis]|uniref:Uncharacterized protein n=1 Tax=Zootermopsis nevadensis TaxID=136037 RepID=A0A067RCX4_ZOONE|nr:hypothetical protein L798_04647 [Zootermopsis nevadensis]
MEMSQSTTSNQSESIIEQVSSLPQTEMSQKLEKSIKNTDLQKENRDLPEISVADHEQENILGTYKLATMLRKQLEMLQSQMDELTVKFTERINNCSTRSEQKIKESETDLNVHSEEELKRNYEELRRVNQEDQNTIAKLHTENDMLYAELKSSAEFYEADLTAEKWKRSILKQQCQWHNGEKLKMKACYQSIQNTLIQCIQDAEAQKLEMTAELKHENNLSQNLLAYNATLEAEIREKDEEISNLTTELNAERETVLKLLSDIEELTKLKNFNSQPSFHLQSTVKDNFDKIKMESEAENRKHLQSSDMMPAVSTEEKTVTCGLATVEESSLNQCEETENTKIFETTETSAAYASRSYTKPILKKRVKTYAEVPTI